MEQPTTGAGQGNGAEPVALSSYVAALAARSLVGRRRAIALSAGRAMTWADVVGDTPGEMRGRHDLRVDHEVVEAS